MTEGIAYPRFSWQEYEEIVVKLSSEILSYLEKNNLKIDTVVPIMRGGSIPATILAYKLGILSVLPVHYHYDFRDKGKMKLNRFLSIERYKDLIPSNPVILLVEGNHCFGNTANAALKDIKDIFPKPKILYATDLADYGHKNSVKADAVFIGVYTNECGTLTKNEAESKGIFPATKLLPWEVNKEEGETIKQKQFEYSDLKNYFSKSKVVKEIDL